MADDEIGSVRDGSTSDHDEKTAVREEDAAPKPSNAAAVRERPYSVFTTKEKWFLVVLCGIAAMFSPLTANIYLPAIPTLVEAFHKSTELINLSVTIYMIMQAIAPMIWGTLGDYWGRRPLFLLCMLILALSSMGLALTPTSAYWLLMVLRAVQAAGSASTVALSIGVIADIANPGERGMYVGIMTLGGSLGPCIGPVIGGGLSQGLGWRSIFWFMCIAAALWFVWMLCFLPETLRSIVGDGSIRPPALNIALIPILGRNSRSATSPTPATKPPPKPFSNPLRLFLNPDILLLLLFNGILYAAFYSVTATLSSLFSTAYPFLSETDLGLCFLAVSGGMLIGNFSVGKLLDNDYAKFKKKMAAKAATDKEKGVESSRAAEAAGRDRGGNIDPAFPIERARLRTMPIWVGIYVACLVGYGWCLQAKVNIAGPLVLQIIIGYTFTAVMNAISILIIDLFPAHGGTITGCNNLVRCGLGAALVSVIDLILEALGTGWTYVVMGAMCLAVSPLLFIAIRFGPRWREQRRRKTLQEKGDR